MASRHPYPMRVPSPSRPAADLRTHARRRTRLRPVKLVTLHKRFIEDGSAVDLSSGGARVRRYGKGTLPPSLILLDEAEGTLRAAFVVWQAHGEIGLRFAGPAERMPPHELSRLAGRFYAV
ncbi:MAG: hypothetical protein VYD57_03355 [Pseudomonadota bacterium]|nr:hypothetical protein [Pseudomonadota bacterium]